MGPKTREIIYTQLKGEPHSKLREIRDSYQRIKLPLDIVGILGMIFASVLFASMQLFGGSIMMLLIGFLAFVRTVCTESISVIDELLSGSTV